MGRMLLLSNVKNASNGQVEGYCIIKSVAQKSNVKGASYLDFILADSGGECVAKLWDYAPELHGMYGPDTVIKIRATVNVWKDEEQLKIDRIRNITPEDEVNMAALVPCAPMEPQAMYDEIYHCAEGFKNEDLRMIVHYILKENKEKLLIFPAALKLHHAYRAGLLYHTLTMLKAAKAIYRVYKEIYPALSEDLIYAGIILHDIAKVKELTVGELGIASAYSVSGQLLGHISTGMAMIERAGAELMVDEHTIMLLQHMMLSHHGVPEFGSPRSPMFPEAEIVSQIDLLDARLYEMYDALSSVAMGEFSERQWALDNRQLYKHGHE